VWIGIREIEHWPSTRCFYMRARAQMPHTTCTLLYPKKGVLESHEGQHLPPPTGSRRCFCQPQENTNQESLCRSRRHELHTIRRELFEPCGVGCLLEHGPVSRLECVLLKCQAAKAFRALTVCQKQHSSLGITSTLHGYGHAVCIDPDSLKTLHWNSLLTYPTTFQPR
jgi:hypothetical protein